MSVILTSGLLLLSMNSVSFRHDTDLHQALKETVEVQDFFGGLFCFSHLWVEIR